MGQRFSVRENEAGFTALVLIHLQTRNDIAVEPLKHSPTGRSASKVAEKDHRADFSTKITLRQFTRIKLQDAVFPRFRVTTVCFTT